MIVSNVHDPLCRGIYQRYTDPKNCASCDLIWAVREDDKRIYSNNIGRLEEEYLNGYSQAIRDIELKCTCVIRQYRSLNNSQEII